jgi:DNA-binding transcriptional MocR family regulator
VLPYEKLHTCINKAMEIYGETQFQYCNTQGFEPLRSAIRQYLSDYQVFADTSKIFITSGSQQALNILSNMEFPNRKKNILVEQPTYLCMLDILNTYKLTTLGIVRDYGNLDIKRLEYLFRTGDIKFFYTMPRFHHPTGTSFTNDQKKAIATLAEKYDVYIVEDDQLAELEMDSRADPLYAFDTSSHVVYIRSFSKALLPGIRLAAIVLPDSLAREFKKYKYLNDVFTSPLLQAALEIFIKSGMHRDHINKIKQFYSQRMNFFKKSWNALGLENVNSNIPDTGFYSWFELPDNIKGDFVKHNLQSKNIYIDSGARYYINDFRKDNTIKICINNVSIDKMKSSLPVIGSEISRLITQKSADSFFIII